MQMEENSTALESYALNSYHLGGGEETEDSITIHTHFWTV